ncbi:MAG: 6-hydroxymethylpterin diphosphokinase MptE-like protein [Spirochaetota bacterium]
MGLPCGKRIHRYDPRGSIHQVVSSPPAIQFLQSRTGELSASVDRRLLYSRYSPSRETRRFVDETLKRAERSDSAPIVVVSDGLGYLEKAVRSSLPRARVFSIHLNSLLSSKSGLPREHICCPDQGCDPGAFLTERLESESLRRVTFIEWDPACRAFASVYERAATRIRHALRRAAGHKATVERWGKLWIRNILRNSERFLFSAGLPHFGTRPVLVVCAGPTLGETLRTVAGYRTLPVIVAVSSTLTTLRNYCIEPDLVVHTDAGFYSSLHIPRNAAYHAHLCGRSAYTTPLTAAPLPVPSAPATLRVISGNSVCEQTAARILGLEPAVVPEAGTVSATATRLASLVSDGPRFVAGLDLASRDLDHHSRPHSFDGYFSAHSGRTNPELSMRFKRSIGMHRFVQGWRTAGNLDLYAQWFRDHTAEFADARRLFPSPVDTGMTPANTEDLGNSLIDWISRASTRNPDSRSEARQRAPQSTGEHRRWNVSFSGMILQGWRDELVRSGSTGALSQELAEWLGCDQNVRDILSALSEFDRGRNRD